MKQTLTILLFFFLSFFSFAQSNFTIKGKVTDKQSGFMMGATATLLQEKDSVLKSFAISKKDGSFELKRIGKGNYILSISFVGYQTYFDNIELTEGTEEILDLGTIALDPIMLDGVTVESERIPIQILGDTVQYDANAFQTRPNAVLEDLLKKLPGIDVERDGTIKAQGETVSKVLVDGKEFFGDDPQMATKNLPADAIDKVQVYDKKSEFTEFSGVDDGNEQKTINIALKEDKKNGIFGNVTGGFGTDERHLAKANINSFNAKTQVSFIGNHNNINEQGFSFNDYMNFMGGLENMMGSGGGEMNIELGGAGIPIGLNMSDGFLTNSVGGLNLNHTFNEKTSLHANYLFSRMGTTMDRFATRTNFLQNGESFASEENTLRESTSFGHRANIRLKHQISKTQDIQLKTLLSYDEGSFDNLEERMIFSTTGELQNQSDSRNHSEGNAYAADWELIYRNKLNKKGRTLTASLLGKVGNDESLGELQTNAAIFNGGQPTRFLVNQEQNNQNQTLDYGVRLSYTEPLGNGKFLQFNTNHQNYTNQVNKDFFDIEESGERLLNSDLTTNFDRDYRYHRGGVNFNWNREKVKFSAGLAYQHSELQGEILSQETTLNQSFRRLLPNLRLGYDLKDGMNLNFRYSTSLNEPTLEQLQPIVNNVNPLNVYQGNPDLAAEFRHNSRLNFVWFDQFSFTGFFAFVNLIYTEDKIIEARTIDENLRQISQPINIDNDLLLTANWSFSRPLKFLGTKFSVRQQLNYNNSALFLNNVQDDVNRWNQSATLTLENLKKEVVDVTIGAKLEYNQTRYSENDLLNQDFVNQTYFSDLTLHLGKKWTLSQSVDYTRFSNESFGSQPDVTIWKADLSYLFLKENRGEFKLSVFDILNQNVGVNRNSTVNFIETERVNSLGRYFLLSFTYKLSAFKGGGFQVKHERVR